MGRSGNLSVIRSSACVRERGGGGREDVRGGGGREDVRGGGGTEDVRGGGGG